MTLSTAEKIQGFLLRPAETFRAIREETFGDAVTYFGVLLVVNAVLSAIVGYLGFSALGMPGTGIAGAGGLGAMIAAFLAAVFLGIIGLLLGRSSFTSASSSWAGEVGCMQTFKAVVYGLTPYYLFGWVPIIGALAGIWGLFIEIFGIRELHDMTTGRAALAWLISVVIVLVILAVLVLIAGLAFLALFGIASSSGPIPVVTVFP